MIIRYQCNAAFCTEPGLPVVRAVYSVYLLDCKNKFRVLASILISESWCFSRCSESPGVFFVVVDDFYSHSCIWYRLIKCIKRKVANNSIELLFVRIHLSTVALINIQMETK